MMNILLWISLWPSLLISNGTRSGSSDSWSSWNKYNDCPGLFYRTSYLGQAFEGSKFHKWQIEVSNGYSIPVEAEIMMVDDFGANISETHKIKIFSGSNKKLIFTNVKSPCSESCELRIFAKMQ